MESQEKKAKVEEVKESKAESKEEKADSKLTIGSTVALTHAAQKDQRIPLSVRPGSH